MWLEVKVRRNLKEKEMESEEKGSHYRWEDSAAEVGRYRQRFR